MFRIRREVYLDNNATTPVSWAVRRRVAQVLRASYGNPSALYRAGRDSAAVLEESREIVARTVNASAPEIFFVGSATEANNSVLHTVLRQAGGGRRKIVASPIEHASVTAALEDLAQQGITVTYLPVSTSGRVDPAAVAKAVDDQTALVTVMLANNEIGTVQDIRAIAEVARRAGAWMMSDCVQALGKVPVDVRALGVDYASFSAHKIHGPKGVGALYVREGSPHRPFIHGGHQEAGMRAGTESLHNIAGFAAACDAVPALLDQRERVAALKQHLVTQLRALAPDAIVHSPERECLSNTLSLALPGKSNAHVIAALDHYGVAVAAGSACNTAENAPSHVLTAIGLPAERARETIRISLSTRTTRREIDYAVRALGDFLAERTPPIHVFAAAQLDRGTLFDPELYILDVRFFYDRKLLKGLPNSHEISFLRASRHLEALPRDKHILVVCQNGPNAPIVAYQLKARGFRRVSTILTGLMGWRLAHPELYKQYAGQNVERLTAPRSPGLLPPPSGPPGPGAPTRT